MKLVRANQASKEHVELFLENNQDVDRDRLLKTGYVVEINEEINGCFVLESVEIGVYWLKQLYITQSEAATLPLLLEAILTLAKHQQAKEVCVNSQQPMVDIILEALQFERKNNVAQPNEKWWSYNVS